MPFKRGSNRLTRSRSSGGIAESNDMMIETGAAVQARKEDSDGKSPLCTAMDEEEGREGGEENHSEREACADSGSGGKVSGEMETVPVDGAGEEDEENIPPKERKGGEEVEEGLSSSHDEKNQEAQGDEDADPSYFRNMRGRCVKILESDVSGAPKQPVSRRRSVRLSCDEDPFLEDADAMVSESSRGRRGTRAGSRNLRDNTESTQLEEEEEENEAERECGGRRRSGRSRRSSKRDNEQGAEEDEIGIEDFGSSRITPRSSRRASIPKSAVMQEQDVGLEDDFSDDFQEDAFVRRSSRTRKYLYESLNINQEFVEEDEKEEEDNARRRSRRRRGRRREQSEEDETDKSEYMVVESEPLRPGLRTRKQLVRIEKESRTNESPKDNRSSSRRRREEESNQEDESEDSSKNEYVEIEEEPLRPGLRSRKRIVKIPKEKSGKADSAQQKEYNLRTRRSEVQRYAPTHEKSERDSKRAALKRAYKQNSSNNNGHQGRRESSHKPRRHRRDTSDSSSDDEYMYGRRKARSMMRGRAECLPMNMTTDEIRGISTSRGKTGSRLADIDPMDFDRNIKFDSVGGLDKHVQALKEMILFPLMYPEVFDRFSISPPRGVLFHGPPGTGKTLVARALANECSIGNQKVAFFMRKGADCLSKWVGESERQLRLLFDQAYTMRPSIIFFDEIDGIAPVRSSKQDQIHSSIVSTLLALMDGIDSRGQVIVIGSTNRIDSIDPALRRPGRFDREFLFPLPNREARRTILKIHTQKWNPRPEETLVDSIADKCVGYCGADLKSLCTETALIALRRRYPQIYCSNDKLLINPKSIVISPADFKYAMKQITPASERSVVGHAKALAKTLRPLIQPSLDRLKSAMRKAFPSVEFVSDKDKSLEDSGCASASNDSNGPSSTLAAASLCIVPKMDEFLDCMNCRPSFLVADADLWGKALYAHLGPALLYEMERYSCYVIDVPALFGSSEARSPEDLCVGIIREARRNAPCVLYMPRIHVTWAMASSTLRSTMQMLIEDIPLELNVVLVGTYSPSAIHGDEQDYEQYGFMNLFTNNVPLSLWNPSDDMRRYFFEQLSEAVKTEPVVSNRVHEMEELPKVDMPTQIHLSKAEVQELEEKEENALRELRIYLRSVTENLLTERKLSCFFKPVNPEEVPDYFEIVRNPMDLQTILQKVDDNMYTTVDSYLGDINLIVDNAVLYNPPDDPERVVHKARALQDLACSMISRLDKEIVNDCNVIAKQRARLGRPIVTPKKLAAKKDVPGVSTTGGTRLSLRLRGVEPEISNLESQSTSKKHKRDSDSTENVNDEECHENRNEKYGSYAKDQEDDESRAKKAKTMAPEDDETPKEGAVKSLCGKFDSALDEQVNVADRPIDVTEASGIGRQDDSPEESSHSIKGGLEMSNGTEVELKTSSMSNEEVAQKSMSPEALEKIETLPQSTPLESKTASAMAEGECGEVVSSKVEEGSSGASEHGKEPSTPQSAEVVVSGNDAMEVSSPKGKLVEELPCLEMEKEVVHVLEIDEVLLQETLSMLAESSGKLNIDSLHNLYNRCMQVLHTHRGSWNKTEALNEIRMIALRQ
eukprot:Nk52_evm17s2133 gene=Nk52_evmTU17s2133